ncbi:MAG: HAD-IIB family hydrolase [bacterium]|nr:HAD-IIB family hydrolase [bacterium]
MNKKYKALMLDVDGTLIPYDYNAIPSDNVTKAVKKAQEKVVVCLVTGRHYSGLGNILKKLEITSGYLVMNNGAHVLNLSTKEILYDQPIDPYDAKAIISVLQEEKIPFHLKQDIYEFSYEEWPFKKGDSVKKAYIFFTHEGFSSKAIDAIFKKLSHLSNLTLYKTHHKHPDKFGFNISHIKATKLHGIYAVAKDLKVSKEKIIGVGDSYNDFPLLMACGLKVAMGNAVSELKEIADYIAPSVDDDGVADVIKKFVL